MSEITAALRKLSAGQLSIEEVAQRFANRDWPKGNPPATLNEAFRRMEDDPAPIVPGSWDEVAVAYTNGLITDQQYETLYDAVPK